MQVDIYTVIVGLCSLVILSYVFTLISKRTRIPQVLLLLLTGILVREVLLATGNYIEVPSPIIEVVGVVGLILILLDAGLDLNFSPDKTSLIKNAATSSLIILVISIVGIASMLHYWLDAGWLASVVFATPMAVISSAVVASSIQGLSERKREFLTYESALSDILGVLLFGYFVSERGLAAGSLIATIIGILVTIVVSVVLALLMVWFMSRVSQHIISFLVFAFLMLVYAVGHIYHLPSLLVVLIFGLIINNWDRIYVYWTDAWAPKKTIKRETQNLRIVTAESAFLVRTFFFTLFGYTINVRSLANMQVLAIGTVIVLIIYLARLIYLRLFAHAHILPELFYAPRGLVTVLLFYRIPEDLHIRGFDAGILFFVILVTTLGMMFGSIFFTPDHATDKADKKRKRAKK